MRIRVTISVGGRFHAFNLAQQLLKRDYLHKLITSYPVFEVKKYGIPSEKIASAVTKEILARGWDKLPGWIRRSYNPEEFIHNLYDKQAMKKIEPTDIFVGWSGYSLYSLRKAKQSGAVAVVERGSSHIAYQNEILKNEYEKFSAATQLPHPKIIEKECMEYEEADYISIPSNFVKRTFLEKGISEKKLIQIPYGVELSSFRQVPKNDNIFRVVFTGRMSLRKGVHYLMKAFSELNLPGSELMLVGSFSDEIKPFFEKYEGKFKWMGRVPQGELYTYYSQGSVFVLMSIEEGLAMVIPQAMACGLPVICTTNTGGEDIVRNEKDGFIVPIGDTEILKEKLLYLYENREIGKAMGQSAKERVSSGFTWDNYGERMIEKYEAILNR
jgi:glycosyltransferase involved in cell wall biosynthesis